MPDGRTHLIAGTVCGAVCSIVIQHQLHENKQLDPGHLLLSTGTGAAVSRLPDILEPALHPNHRAFFHSFIFGAILGYSGVEIWKKMEQLREKRKARGIQQISWQEFLLALILIGIGVFVLHLLMDAFTKKGLPLI
jgi:inner membrane protein